MTQTVRPSRRRLLIAVWFLVTIAGLGLCASAWLPVRTPGWAPTTGAVVITTMYAAGLAARTGARAVLSGALALMLATTAVIWGQPVLLSGVAVATAALAAILGVMATKPAARFRRVTGEVVLASLVAATGAFAVDAYDAPVSVERAGYLALAVALLGAVALVYRLGAGIHGLGRRGAIGVVSGIGLLFFALAYTEALSRWGTGELTTGVANAISWIHATFGAVPRPTEFLLGFPALAWGVSTRARRRQGWWVCAFGAAGLAVVSTSLLNPAMPLSEAALVHGYGLLIGLVLGYGAIRADAYLTGTRGRRARRLEEAAAHRPEPARFDPLL